MGNWSGDYSDGKKPTHWTGSAKILRQYEINKGDPVCFGQCWVFSGLVTTGTCIYHIRSITVSLELYLVNYKSFYFLRIQSISCMLFILKRF